MFHQGKDVSTSIFISNIVSLSVHVQALQLALSLKNANINLSDLLNTKMKPNLHWEYIKRWMKSINVPKQERKLTSVYASSGMQAYEPKRKSSSVVPFLYYKVKAKLNSWNMQEPTMSFVNTRKNIIVPWTLFQIISTIRPKIKPITVQKKLIKFKTDTIWFLSNYYVRYSEILLLKCEQHELIGQLTAQKMAIVNSYAKK